MRRFYRKIRRLLAVALSTAALSAPLVLSVSHLALAQLPKPPERGTPTGEPIPGGTRPDLACPKTQKPLTAIIANRGKDFTVSPYPSFWFYVPYQAGEIRYLEFAIKDPQTSKTVYRTALQLKGTPGIIEVTIPSESAFALAPGNIYQWDLQVYCQKNQIEEPDLRVNGWVQRIPLPPQLENQYQAYREREIWYDAITHLAEQHFANPGDTQLAKNWRELLADLGMESLAGEQLVKAELVSPDTN